MNSWNDLRNVGLAYVMERLIIILCNLNTSVTPFESLSPLRGSPRFAMGTAIPAEAKELAIEIAVERKGRAVRMNTREKYMSKLEREML